MPNSRQGNRRKQPPNRRKPPPLDTEQIEEAMEGIGLVFGVSEPADDVTDELPDPNSNVPIFPDILSPLRPRAATTQIAVSADVHHPPSQLPAPRPIIPLPPSPLQNTSQRQSVVTPGPSTSTPKRQRVVTPGDIIRQTKRPRMNFFSNSSQSSSTDGSQPSQPLLQRMDSQSSVGSENPDDPDDPDPTVVNVSDTDTDFEEPGRKKKLDPGPRLMDAVKKFYKKSYEPGKIACRTCGQKISYDLRQKSYGNMVGMSAFC